MAIVTNDKQISAEERVQIRKQVRAELTEHLYQGCLPGVIVGIPGGLSMLWAYYGHTPFDLLIGWLAVYVFGLINLTLIYFAYKKFKPRFEMLFWLRLYCAGMIVCAISWTGTILIIPDNQVRQFITFIALYIVATGYTMGSIGVFQLCLITVNIILIPLIAWCFYQGGILYNLVGVISLIYNFFMIGINHRSTEWLKDSLKLKLENTLVSYQVNHDFLTDLPNQRLIPRFIESAIAATKGSQDFFVVVSFSLNRMEIINDSLGSQAGDSIIQSVAKRLSMLSAIPAANIDSTQYVITISRKDTFNIVIVPVQLETFEQRVKRLFSVLEEPFYMESKPIKLTASIGVSVYPRDAEKPELLIANADAAMLRAKQYGGNRVEYYRAEINAQMPRMLELETDLHDAIKDSQFQVYFQPLIDAKKRTIVGMEALIRWPHPVHGMVSPVQFIPIAEETGLIIPIGAWVLQEACRQTKAWHDMGFPHLKVAVNIAEKQLRDESIIGILKHILNTTKLDPKCLELELTETAMLDESVVAIIKEFKSLGLSIAVDDFGTGYSGFGYLKRFDIDKLKIDQSFVRDIPGNNDSISIISAIIAMAKEMHVKTLAEGVETEEQLLLLQEKGCDYIQGYYFSKPLEISSFTKLLLAQESEADLPA